MTAPSLQLHYHLRDGAHEMNAFIRNKCEAEMLAAFQYFAEQLGVELIIECKPAAEGGFKEWWAFAFKPEHGYTNAMLLLGMLLNSFINVWNAPPKPNKELDAINVEIAKQTLEEKRLANEKARLELKNAGNSDPQQSKAPPVAAPPPVAASAVAPPPHGVSELTSVYELQIEPELTINKKALAHLAADPRLSVRRSTFYKTLIPYDKVTAFGLGVRKSTVAVQERIVNRREFVRFVMTTDKLPPLVVEEAVVHITAPVIDGSDFKWKGLLNGETISFSMKDESFKGMVERREVSFQNGNAIRCRLVIERKLDDEGAVAVTARTAEVVLEKLDETGKAIETAQGKQQRFADKQAKAQQPLFNYNVRDDS